MIACKLECDGSVKVSPSSAAEHVHTTTGTCWQETADAAPTAQIATSLRQQSDGVGLVSSLEIARTPVPSCQLASFDKAGTLLHVFWLGPVTQLSVVVHAACSMPWSHVLLHPLMCQSWAWGVGLWVPPPVKGTAAVVICIIAQA